MSEPCRYVATNQPRMIRHRHAEGCPSQATGDDLTAEQCPGCLPCPERHCGVCRRSHAPVTCADCVGAAREDLNEVADMCNALPGEAVYRGVNSNAAMLTGPAANPEARQYVEASYLAGRLPEGWIEASHGHDCPLLAHEACVGCAGGERHPLTVLGTWEMVWRDYLEHHTDLPATLPRIIDYLDDQLTYMSGQEEPPFEDFARDLRNCRSYLQDVLHDANQGDRANVGCFDCGGDLERQLTRSGFEDHWTCRRCRRRYTYAEYNFALRAALERTA